MKVLSINQKGVIGIVAICLVIIGVDGWLSLNARSGVILEMRSSASNLAQAAAQQAGDTFKETDTILASIVERVEHDGVAGPAAAKLEAFMRASLDWLPQIDTIIITDSSGKVVASTKPPGENVEVGDREYFTYLRDHSDSGTIHIGTPILNRVTHKWGIPVARRLNRPDGGFYGIVGAMIDPAFFQQFYLTLNIGREGAMALMLEDGSLLMRVPFRGEFLGGVMGNGQLPAGLAAQGPVGTASYRSAIDGIERYGIYRKLDRYPVAVLAALSVGEALGAWRLETLLHAAGVLFLVVVISVLGWYLLRQSNMLAQLNQTFEQLAMQDGLTGLANRRQFDAALESELSRAKRQRAALALIMIDVDFFKQFNDIYGHVAGDECLKAVARTLGEVTARRAGDLVARYGGEEFAVLLPGATMRAAMSVARKLIEAIRELKIPHEGSPGGVVTMSAGAYALQPADTSDEPWALVGAADQALYAAKNGGRNRACGWPMSDWGELPKRQRAG